MIFPFEHDGDGRSYVPNNQSCTNCDREITQKEKSIHFGWPAADVYFCVACAEEVALMIMRDVAECRCGKEVANARYKQVRRIVPYRD